MDFRVYNLAGQPRLVEAEKMEYNEKTKMWVFMDADNNIVSMWNPSVVAFVELPKPEQKKKLEIVQ